MKKVFLILLAVVLSVTMIVPVFAQEVTVADRGVSYTLSDSWQKTEESSSGISYVHSNGTESMIVEYVDLQGVQFGESEYLVVAENVFSAQSLADNLTILNGARTTVKINWNDYRWEYIHGIEFFRYEVEYTASAYGYYDATFYNTCYMTQQNGTFYSVAYERGVNDNNFADVYNMLSSIKFNEKINITIDGEPIFPDSAPIMENDRTLVPIRAVAEKMGYTLEWDEAEQIVTIYETSTEYISIKIDDNKIIKGKEEIEIDVPAKIIGSRTYLPLRAVTEALGASVNWVEETNTVEIFSQVV